jgi:hypothetical protein
MRLPVSSMGVLTVDPLRLSNLVLAFRRIDDFFMFGAIVGYCEPKCLLARSNNKCRALRIDARRYYFCLLILGSCPAVPHFADAILLIAMMCHTGCWWPKKMSRRAMLVDPLKTLGPLLSNRLRGRVLWLIILLTIERVRVLYCSLS